METYSPRAGRAFSSLAGVCAALWIGALGCGQAAPSGGEDTGGEAGDTSSGTSATSTGAAGASQSGSGGGGGQASGTGGQGTGGQGTGGVGPSGSSGSMVIGGAGSTGAAGTAVVGLDAGRPMRTGPLRIMPVGDSTTMATCWRAKLAQILDMKHKGDYDFVGTQKNGGCGVTYDPDNEAHGGYLITQHTSEFAGWAAANTVDVMLLHFATNDCWNSLAPAKILDAYTTLVTEFRKKSPNAVIVVAQLIPLGPTGCDPCQNNIKTFNAAVPAWATKTNTAQSPVIVVDQWTGYDVVADNRDGVHPNDTTGSTKMAQKWDEALEGLF